jgi:hypothetical protein
VIPLLRHDSSAPKSFKKGFNAGLVLCLQLPQYIRFIKHNSKTSTANRNNMMGLKTPVLLLVSSMTVAVCQNTTYKPVDDYSGAGFLDSFKPYINADPSHGLAKYTGLEEANASSMIGTISGGPADGSVYIGLDFSAKAPGGRRSVRLESKKAYGKHLMIADIHHMPSVCGVWPALWFLGKDPWPQNGEIDYVESVNGDSSANRMSLHTQNSLKIANHSMYMRGTLLADDCAAQGSNVGCTVEDAQNATSAGSKFNDNGGGVFAGEFSSSGVQLWFFPRGSSIPADIVNGTPNPSYETWGLPNGMFMGDDSTDWSSYFRELKLIINTSLCGDWAGKIWASSPTCASLAPTCEEYVASNPQAFKEAYWAIKRITMYQS